MHHQCGHRDFLQIRGEIGLGEGHDAVVVGLGPSHHALAPPVLDDAFRDFRSWPVKTVERARRQVAIELRPIGGDLSLQSLDVCLPGSFVHLHLPVDMRAYSLRIVPDICALIVSERVNVSELVMPVAAAITSRLSESVLALAIAIWTV